MPIDIRWDDSLENTLRITYHQPWNWQDYQDGMDRATVILESMPGRTDVIADVGQAGLLPQNALAYLRYGVTRARAANLDTTVIVGVTGLPALLMQTLRHLYPGAMRNIREADTIDAARALLVDMRKANAVSAGDAQPPKRREDG